MKRKNQGGTFRTVFEDSEWKGADTPQDYSREGGVPLEVPPGSIVLLHGNFVHYSEKNINEHK